MKQHLSPKAVAAAIAGVAALLLIGAFVLFKGSFAPAPTVTPKRWGPPGHWAGPANAGGAMGAGQSGGGAPGAPIGAPATGG